MDNRYLDPETGKFKESFRNEAIGLTAGGLAGALGVNAINAYNQYKNDLVEQEGYRQAIPLAEQDIANLANMREDHDVLRRIKTNPSLLREMTPEQQSYYGPLFDTADRLQERSKWVEFDENPLFERIKMKFKGKPSLDNVDPEALEHIRQLFGNEPFSPEVGQVLAAQAEELNQHRDILRAVAEEKVNFPVRQMAPTLDQFRPKNLFNLVRHPAVVGGAMAGMGIGKAVEEYQRNAAHILEREKQKQLEKSAGVAPIAKLKLPASNTKKPLIPKQVKRVGMLAGGAGVLGYTGYKATKDFAAGTQLAPSEQNQEGMIKKMAKTHAEKYEELSKVAFDKEALSLGGAGNTIKGFGTKAKDAVAKPFNGFKNTLSGKNVADAKAAERIGQSMKMPEEQLKGLAGNVKKQQVKRVGAIGGLAAGAAGAATYGGVQVARKLEGQDDHMKTAGEKYDELAKVAFQSSPSDDYWQTYTDHQNRGAGRKALDAMHAKGVDAAEAVRNIDPAILKRLGIGAGAVAGAGALGGGGYAAYNHFNGQEKVAKEMTEEKSQYAIDHPIAKSVKDGAKWGAIAGLPFMGIGAVPGAVTGSILGLGVGASRKYANNELRKEDGMSGAGAGALMGGTAGLSIGLPGASVLLANQDNLKGLGINVSKGRIAANLLGNAAIGAVGGGLIGRNQEKHRNNLEHGQFATTNDIENPDKLQKHASVTPEDEQGMGAVGKGALIGGGAGLAAGGAGLAAFGANNVPEGFDITEGLIAKLQAKNLAPEKLQAAEEAAQRIGQQFSPRQFMGASGGVIGGAAGLLGGAALGAGAGALANHFQDKQAEVNNEDEIDKEAAEAINGLFKEASETIDQGMNKVAGYEDPINKITFGYDMLKRK